MATSAEAILAIIFGMKKGLILLGPLSVILLASVSKVSIPPIPVAMITPARS